MNDRRPHRFARSASWLAPLSVCIALFCAPSRAATTPQARLPGTPVGHLADELIRHANAGDPAQVRQWGATILSPSVGSDDREAFVAGLASAAGDSGGLDVFDVRTDPRQPGLLEVAVKGRRDGRRALFWLAADPLHPDRLAQAGLVPMEDPELYADWPKAAVARAELAKLIQGTLDRLVRADDFSGCISVMEGGSTVFDECQGLAERRFGVPVDHQTRFHIGSMDKMFTAVAIAQLVEAGKLSWNDTLAKRVPEYPDGTAARKITVWELLHHTAGLGDFMVPEYFGHRERFVGPVDYLGLIARQPLVSEPGKQWNYSNAGYVLLGRIIENVSGESYAQYIQRHVFAPSHMTDSGFDSVDEVIPKLAVGYYRDALFSSTWKADWLKTAYQAGPAGGGYATNADLLRFAKALREGRLVKPATLAKMFDDEVPAGPGAYAAGFGDRLSHGRHVRGHAGGIEGTTANLAMVWETGAAMVLTSNEGPSTTWLLAEHVADLLAAEGAKH